MVVAVEVAMIGVLVVVVLVAIEVVVVVGMPLVVEARSKNGRSGGCGSSSTVA
jgi:hypothetical protein